MEGMTSKILNYRDYKINSDIVDRQFFYSPLGEVVTSEDGAGVVIG